MPLLFQNGLKKNSNHYKNIVAMNAPDKIYMPNDEGQDACYINKQSLVTFIEDLIAENLENTTDANHDNHEGYHQACWDIIYRIKQMCK